MTTKGLNAIGFDENDQAYMHGLRFIGEHELEVPSFKPGKFGDWEIVEGKVPPVTRGYYATNLLFEHPDWGLRKDGRIWMGITPRELESQVLHNAFAQGHVVMMGLGLGALLYNLCRNPRVTKITVVERDLALLRGFPDFSDWHHWAGNTKVEFHETDALTMEPLPHDTLLADIWPYLGGHDIDQDSQHLAQRWKSPVFMWWGMELCYMFWAMRNEVDNPPAQGPWDQWKREFGFNIPAWEYWPVMATAAASIMAMDYMDRHVYRL